MTAKYSSKEIHFLKSESDDVSLEPPDTYFGDQLLNKTAGIKKFEKRITDTAVPGDDFFCAVLKISSATDDLVQEQASQAFEDTFNSLLDHDRGLWENIDETCFAVAFWDYKSKADAKNLLVSLKDKLSRTLKADILIGMAIFPFSDFLKTDTLANALKALDHAAFFGPDAMVQFDATSLNISGDRLYQLNQYELAIKDYKDGLRIEPKNINLLNSLGVCYGVMGDLEKAKKEFDSAMAVNPNDLIVIHNIGLICQIDNDPDKAIVYLRKAHGIDDQVFEVELLLGHLLFKKDKPDQAMPFLDRAARLNPKSAMAFRLRGEIFLSQNQPEKAGSEFNSAIKLNPSDAVSLSGYAKSLELQGKNLNIALSFARNSLAIEPDNALFKARLKAIEEKIDAHGSGEAASKSA